MLHRLDQPELLNIFVFAFLMFLLFLIEFRQLHQLLLLCVFLHQLDSLLQRREHISQVGLAAGDLLVDEAVLAVECLDLLGKGVTL